MRRQVANTDGSVWADPTAIATPDLEALREHCRKHGLVCLPRDPNDEPQILETWL